MSTPLEEVRAQLARHDSTVVAMLAKRALCGRAPDGFYAGAAGSQALANAVHTVALAAFNGKIAAGYVATVVPMLEPPATGAPAVTDAIAAADTAALRAIADRLELSLQVAACKLDGRDSALRATAAAGNAAAVEALITYPSVEQLVLLRVRSRTADYVRTHNTPPALASRLPTTLHAVYATWLIPLSRAIQSSWLVAAAAENR